MVSMVWSLCASGAAVGNPGSATTDQDPKVPAESGAQDSVVGPRGSNELHADIILLEPLIRDNSWWLQLAVSGTIFDVGRNQFVGRWAPAVALGRRYSRFGGFFLAELDQSFEFTIATERLDVLNVGLGVETLYFAGHVRSSLAAGASVLLSATSIDEPGSLGWFVDFRPGALRWGWGKDLVVELTPLALDVVVPVPGGLPLVLFSYMTTLGIEWRFLP